MRGNTEVLAIFELLVEEIEREMKVTQDMLHGAMEDRKYDRVKAFSQRVQFLSEIFQRVVELQEEYERASRKELMGVGLPEEKPKKRKLYPPRGARTPEEAFYRPILQCLVEMGGRARAQDVLNRLGELMEGKFTEYDLQPVSSRSREIRWQNTARWARHTLVSRGLLRKDSPYGVWEITEEGRKALEEGRI